MSMNKGLARTVRVRSLTFQSVGGRHYSDGSGPRELRIDPIKPSKYRQNLHVASLLGDTHISHLPSISTDKYSSYPFKSNKITLHTRDPKVGKLLMLIRKHKKASAWYLFKELHAADTGILKRLTYEEVSGFLRLYSSGVIEARDCWSKMKFIAEAAKESGHVLLADDYSELIECAYKNGQFDSVEELWQEAQSNQVIPNTELWNSYIAAVCNTNVNYWPVWEYTKDSPEKRKIPMLIKQSGLIYARQDITRLIEAMYAQNISLNARTYELALLYFAQIGELGKCRQILKDLWKLEPFDEAKPSSIVHPDTRPLRDDLLFPTVSTLNTIVDIFGYNDEVTEGLYYVFAMIHNYHISVVGKTRHQFWHNLLKWIFITTEPNRGKTPKEVFDKIWNLITVNYQIKPDLLMYSWRIKHLKSTLRFTELSESISAILEAEQGHMKSATALDIACQAYKRCTVGLIMQGRIEEAEAVLNKWSAYDARFEKIRSDVLAFKDNLNQGGGSEPEGHKEPHGDEPEVKQQHDMDYLRESKVSAA